jgi:hypothetical protein
MPSQITKPHRRVEVSPAMDCAAHAAPDHAHLSITFARETLTTALPDQTGI